MIVKMFTTHVLLLIFNMRIGVISSMNTTNNTTMGLTMQLQIGDCIPKKVCKVQDFIGFVAQKKTTNFIQAQGYEISESIIKMTSKRNQERID